MANKVIEASDLATYPYATIGDIIIDTPTTVHADGSINYQNTTAAATFPTARLGATIWIDGNAGVFYNFRLTNGDINEWMISDENNYVHVRPAPGTQVKMVRNPSTNGGYLMIMYDVKYCVIDGENHAFPGLSRAAFANVFLRGSFGFHLSGGIYPIGGHQLVTKPPDIDGSHYIIRGVEAENGFSALRHAATKFSDPTHPNRWCDYTVDRCYLHDGGDGERIYAGATHAGPMYLLRNLTITNTILARGGCENIQVQLLFTTPETRGTIRNNVSWATAMEWIKAFQPNQDTGLQWSLEDGGNYVERTIFDGCGSNALNNFGANQLAVKQERPSIVQDCLFKRGRHIFAYVHPSCQYGVHRVIRRIWLKEFDGTYYHDGINNVAPYYISMNNGGDKCTWGEIKHDGAKPAVFEDTATPNYEWYDISDSPDVVPDVEYVRSGAHEPSTYWMHWKPTWANSFDDPTPDKPVKYLPGWVVTNVEQGVEYAFYLVLVEHTTTGLDALNPRLHILANGETVYKRLRWDANGVRNDQPGYISTGFQSDYPPDDFRLKSNNFYNKLGYGLQINEPNTEFELFQWELADDNIGTGARLPVDFHILERPPREEERGKWMRIGILTQNENGIWDTSWRFSPWRLVG